MDWHDLTTTRVAKGAGVSVDGVCSNGLEAGERLIVSGYLQSLNRTRCKRCSPPSKELRWQSAW
jgi:hypothetical protein